MEGAIIAYTSQLEEVQKAYNKINLRMQEQDTSMNETIGFLEILARIIEWQEDIENVQDTVFQFNAQELSVLKNVFIEGIDDLQASAQVFLDHPYNVFGNICRIAILNCFTNRWSCRNVNSRLFCIYRFNVFTAIMYF